MRLITILKNECTNCQPCLILTAIVIIFNVIVRYCYIPIQEVLQFH